jgi:hypothetical protein
VLPSVVVLAVAMRLIALERTPPLSTDAYRYLWDGRVANADVNPFTHAPNAPELRALHDANWRRISFKQVSTIYPPAAQLIFAGLARARDSDTQAFRWTFALCDIGCVLALIALLRRTGVAPERVIWYAWCPLPVTETTAGGHVDAFALFLFLLSLLAISRSGKGVVTAGIALAGAVMAKGVAVVAAPFLLRRGGWKLALSFFVTCGLLLAPYAAAGSHLFAGLRWYLAGWKTNASAFLVLDRLLAAVTEAHFGVTRAITAGAVVLAIAILAARMRPGMESLLGVAFLAIGAQLLIGAPTFPWYAIWVVPALCWWRVPGLALFTLTVSAQYYARRLYPDDRAAHYALLWAGYLPVYALFVGQLIWWRVTARSRKAANAAASTQSTGSLPPPGPMP